MDILQAHNRERRSEGARGVLINGALLVATVGVGVSLVSNPPAMSATPSPNRVSETRVTDLEHTTADQRQEINQLRTLLDVCLTGARLCAQVTPEPSPFLIRQNGTDQRRVTEVVHTETVRERDQPTPEPAPQPPAVKPKPTEPAARNNVKKTTDTVKHAVEGVIDKADKATAKAKGHHK